jgi:hypothetical protein
MKGIHLKTRTERAFGLMLASIVLIAFGWAYLEPHPSHPTSKYFFSTDGSQIDIRSPNSRLIIDVGYLETSRSLQELQARCDDSLRKAPLGPIGANYRGVELCNSTNSIGADFEIRDKYFRSRVDDLYARYYSDLSMHYIKYVVLGIAVWFAVLMAWFAFRWVRNGLPSPR